MYCLSKNLTHLTGNTKSLLGSDGRAYTLNFRKRLKVPSDGRHPSSTYTAEDTTTKEEFAVKVLPRNGVDEKEYTRCNLLAGSVQDPSGTTVATRGEDVPVVKTHAFIKDIDAYLIMEKLGSNLEDIPRPSNEGIKRIALEMLRSLRYLHEKDIHYLGLHSKDFCFKSGFGPGEVPDSEIELKLVRIGRTSEVRDPSPLFSASDLSGRKSIFHDLESLGYILLDLSGENLQWNILTIPHLRDAEKDTISHCKYLYKSKLRGNKFRSNMEPDLRNRIVAYFRSLDEYRRQLDEAKSELNTEDNSIIEEKLYELEKEMLSNVYSQLNLIFTLEDTTTWNKK